MANYGEHEPGDSGRYGEPAYGEPAYPGAAGGGSVTPAGPPPSTKRAVMLIWVSVGLSVLSTILSFLFIDDLVDQSIDAQSGSTTLDRDTVQTVVIITVIITLVISVGIAALFAWLISKGKNWARIVYTVLAALGVVFGLAGVGSQPAVLIVFQVIGLLLTIAIIVLLYQRDSNEYFKRG